ncbi:hypothetical protein [Mesorhizobium jarvisii]|nr:MULTISPECIES: hypothetical protein [Mesorhizobium]
MSEDTVTNAYWLMVGLGAVCALGLAGAVTLLGWLMPRPKCFGFDVKDDR